MIELIYLSEIDRYNLINIDMDTQIGDRQDVLEGYREQVGCKGCSMF